MKKVLQVVLLLSSIALGYLTWESINGPIKFEKTKKERFEAVIRKLKDIRNVQEAHFKVRGTYAKNFDSLVNFVETDKFIITTQRDTSWTEYDRVYRIDVVKQGIVIDTLGFVSVKDSLFKDSDRYKKMNILSITGLGQTCNIDFQMQTAEIEKNNYKSPVFEVKVSKEQVLCGLDEDEIHRELTKESVNDVKGAYISVGSLQEVSTNGNWPSYYDAQINKKDNKK